jgi:very-short-patch-repair endonuclease
MEEKKYKKNLHEGSRASTYEHARGLRHTQTDAEKKLWSLLRNRQLKGKKFRRQHPFADYILDFYCHECKLSVELDGNFHTEKDQREYDEARTRLLNEFKITVLRFWNHEVMNGPEKVIEKIAACLY